MDDRDNWMQVEALFDAAWERPAGERDVWLRAQPVALAVIEQVLALLDAAQASDRFLERPQAPVDDNGDLLLAPGDRAGAWRIVRLLGRGGMGEVYEAQRDDGLFDQRGALKLIAGADARDWMRFDAERRILAGLEHPGIARLIDGGLLHGDRPYMVMEHVDGLPIDVHCDQAALSLPARVAVLRQVAEALAHAHERLVVHSDLKPSNILVDAAGRARLIDFGIAHLVEAHDGQRPSRLSPDYAAPEQLEDRAVSTATDVYGLAAVLYRLIAGRPVRHTSGVPVAVAVARIATALPAPPSTHAAKARGATRALLEDLDAIVLKALAADPSVRYRSIQAFDQDLERALHRGVVKARSGERGYAWGRWLRRHAVAAFAIGAVTGSLAIGLGLAVMQGHEAARQRDEAVRERARLEAIQQTVFHMFRSAGETRGADATAGEVLDAAAQRLQDQFARDPAAGAPTLHALGELYFLLNDYEAAAPLLRRLAQADPVVVDPALIAAARFDLAQIELRQGDQAAAQTLLDQAQSFWRSDSVRWQSRLIDSRVAEAQLLREAGEPEAAVALLRQALADRIAASGADHRETGMFHNNLGVHLFGIGDFDAARAAFNAAREVWRRAGLEQSPDALNTLNNWGSVEIAAGDLVAAEPLLHEAVELRRRYFGASAATAALLNNYGKLLLRLQRADAAVPILEDAVGQGQRFAGAGSVLHVAALSGLAEAQLAAGRATSAEASAEAALRVALDHLGPDHPATAMAGLAMAQVRAGQDRLDDVRDLLVEAERIAALVGVAGQRLTQQVQVLRARYHLESPADPAPAPGTATPSP